MFRSHLVGFSHLPHVSFANVLTVSITSMMIASSSIKYTNDLEGYKTDPNSSKISTIGMMTAMAVALNTPAATFVGWQMADVEGGIIGSLAGIYLGKYSLISSYIMGNIFGNNAAMVIAGISLVGGILGNDPIEHFCHEFIGSIFDQGLSY